jgi:LCP family protein required for cell wall assembly
MRVYTADGGKKKKRRWLRVLLWSFGIILLLVAVAAGGLYWYLQDAVSTITTPKDQVQKDATKELTAAPAGLPGQPRVALVIGEDTRPGDQTSRSDTMMLVRLDPKTKAMTVMSFPRDLVVDIPGHGAQPINQAFALGGEKLALQTVKQLTGITPNYLVPVNFKGFEELVNVFGGVWVEVDRRYYNKNTGTESTNYDEINLEPGYQRLTGKQALDFARYRHSDSDVARVGRQQSFIREFKKRLDLWTAAKDLFKLIGVAKDNVKILGAAGAAPDTDTFLEYGRLMGEIGGNVISVQLSVGEYSGNKNWVQTSPDELQRGINEFLHPDLSVANKIADRDLAKDTTKAAVKPLFRKGNARIEIRNGGNAGDTIAGDVEYLLAGRGWKRVYADGNADTFTYLHTTIYHDGTKGGEAIANALDKDFAGAQVKPMTPAIRQKLETQNPLDAGVLIVVGRDWSGELATTTETQLPPATQASLTAPDPTRDLAEWKAAQKKAGIPLMMPTRLEAHMRLGDPDPSGYPAFRAYKAAKYPAAHVTYGGENVYATLTFQAIRWRDPPIAEAPQAVRQDGGRTYELFFNGDKIHRIVWRDANAGVTYWISNSFTDFYPNAAMIGIAKSFVPVPAK